MWIMRRLWCWLRYRHRPLTFVRNVFGDEVNQVHCRSYWLRALRSLASVAVAAPWAHDRRGE